MAEQALPSKETLASRTRRWPSFMTISGFTSRRLMSFSVNALYRIGNSFFAVFAAAPSSSSASHQLGRHRLGHAGVRINRHGDDLFRGFLGHRFDVHAAFGGHNEGRTADGAVNQDGEVKLALNVGAVFDVEAVDLTLPAGPVCLVTSVLPSISLALALTTSSTRLARRTPPLASAPSSLNLPLPRPPAWICDFTTQSGPGSASWRRLRHHRRRRSATPSATGAPYSFNTALA
jgi:hypothetical protein